jgi:hypothetical protein
MRRIKKRTAKKRTIRKTKRHNVKTKRRSVIRKRRASVRKQKGGFIRELSTVA